MRTIGSAPSLVPFGADQTVYLVVDGAADGGSLETEIERPDLETIVCELLAGVFNDPVRVLAFNTLEHWSKDVSKEIAREIQLRSDIDAMPVPEYLEDFIERHERPTVSTAA